MSGDALIRGTDEHLIRARVNEMEILHLVSHACHINRMLMETRDEDVAAARENCLQGLFSKYGEYVHNVERAKKQ